jgi:hypothetical protein
MIGVHVGMSSSCIVLPTVANVLRHWVQVESTIPSCPSPGIGHNLLLVLPTFAYTRVCYCAADQMVVVSSGVS